MPIEVLPLGVQCNLRCQYCYQNPMRDAGNERGSYDLAAILKGLLGSPEPLMLFGGEPLMMPLEDLCQLWAFGLGRHGGSSMQTNGLLVTDEHIAAFRRFRVTCGVSVDGPAELNDARWAGTQEDTRAAAVKVMDAIRRLAEAGMPPPLIVTLHRGNASAERLPVLCAWFRELDELGVPVARLHLLEAEDEDIRAKYSLTPGECLAAIETLEALERELKHLRFDLFSDLRKMLTGADEQVTCVWTGCDPYTTDAVQALLGDGSLRNCGRTNKDGVDFAKAETPGFERYVTLYHTPQEEGGCQDCRFFLSCKGNCPGTAVSGDWRNRTEHCDVLKTLFGRLEGELVASGEVPLSLHPRRPELEARALGVWSSGKNARLHELLSQPEEHVEPPPAELAPFVRVSWADDTARDVWAPRFRTLAALFEVLEWRSVAAGLRRAAVIPVAAARRAEAERDLAQHGLALLDVESTDPSRVAVGRPAELESFRAAWQSLDEKLLARLLGTPECCARARATDEVWAFALATGAASEESSGALAVDLKVPAELNPFWSRLGIRVTPHLPCGADCEASDAMAGQLVELARGLGADQELDWLLEVLAWPVERSSLHGLVETKTPVLKMIHEGARAYPEQIVRLHGSAFPEEGAAGLTFAFETPRRRRVRDSAAHRRGLENE
jgi:uncharacterized protein